MLEERLASEKLKFFFVKQKEELLFGFNTEVLFLQTNTELKSLLQLLLTELCLSFTSSCLGFVSELHLFSRFTRNTRRMLLK